MMTLIDRLHKAENVVVFTGAGISTESGIPDFRSPGGVWSRLQPIDFRDFMASEEMRLETWSRKIQLDTEIGKPDPNDGHYAIARMIAARRVDHVITQNIDNLHQNSGVPADKITELHGNGTYAKCVECEQVFDIEPIKQKFRADGQVPVCACGGFIKSATVSFGQSMPPDAMQIAEQVSLACDLFIAVGSSLKVFPAAGFPILAKQNGAGLVIINREPTDLDSIADLVVHDEIGKVLAAAADAVLPAVS